MLKRIALIGDCPSDFPTTDRDDIQLVTAGPGDLPQSTDAILVAGDSAALDAAVVFAQRHEALLILLAEAIDCREQFKPGSSQRVVEHAARFAKALGLSPDDQITLERGALLRDIGKLKIANDVLLKDTLLTYDEWKLIYSHPGIGADLVAQTDGLNDTEDIVRYHHECFDGTGYPNELEGEAIPKLARMVKIIDVFCAMTSPRIYRDTVATKDQAFEYMQEERGKHFDPELVDVFIQNDVGGEAVPQA